MVGKSILVSCPLTPVRPNGQDGVVTSASAATTTGLATWFP
jgi:hypothetical protein